jgi:DNA-binding MarR family transcriptional regulator
VVLSPTAMSRFVDRAVKAGRVRREPDADDRRAQQVVITEEGIDLLRRMWPIYERGIRRYFAEHVVTPDPLRDTLARIADSAR